MRPQASWLALFGDSLSFSHGVRVANDDGVGVVDDAVADSVGEDRITELGVPTANVELGAEDGGGLLVPGLDDLQQIPRLTLFQREQQPFARYCQELCAK